ncbi:MAG: hypothetical protein KDA93_27335 [Planctomycetaceae bacterium]|nr:hypothetical protein [Planctomycetaceae bacterium]
MVIQHYLHGRSGAERAFNAEGRPGKQWRVELVSVRVIQLADWPRPKPTALPSNDVCRNIRWDLKRALRVAPHPIDGGAVGLGCHCQRPQFEEKHWSGMQRHVSPDLWSHLRVTSQTRADCQHAGGCSLLDGVLLSADAVAVEGPVADVVL